MGTNGRQIDDQLPMKLKYQSLRIKSFPRMENLPHVRSRRERVYKYTTMRLKGNTWSLASLLYLGVLPSRQPPGHKQRR